MVDRRFVSRKTALLLEDVQAPVARSTRPPLPEERFPTPTPCLSCIHLELFVPRRSISDRSGLLETMSRNALRSSAGALVESLRHPLRKSMDVFTRIVAAPLAGVFRRNRRGTGETHFRRQRRGTSPRRGEGLGSASGRRRAGWSARLARERGSRNGASALGIGCRAEPSPRAGDGAAKSRGGARRGLPPVGSAHPYFSIEHAFGSR